MVHIAVDLIDYVALTLGFYISASEEWEPFRLLRNRPVKPCSLTKIKCFIYVAVRT